jgi:hypothetical protein
LPEHWKPFVGDLNEPATLEPALRSVEHVFLLPGFRDMDGAGVHGADQGVARLAANLDGTARTTHDLPNQLRTEASQHVGLGNSLHRFFAGEQPPVKAIADHPLQFGPVKLRRDVDNRAQRRRTADAVD